MEKKLIIDGDQATDDAVALALLLFDPEIEVLAITATEGSVTADQANINLQAIIAELDPARYPRFGMAIPCEVAPPINTTYLFGPDGLGNSGFNVSQKQNLMPAEKLMIDCIRKYPGDVSILCLGPLTNIARALQRDPAINDLVDRIIITGGSVSGIGNISAVSEFNFYFDPPSARTVFRSRLTKSLVPLDVTRQVTFGLDLMQELPPESCRIGSFLRKILPFAFRAFRQQLGRETITLNDAVGALSVLEPDLFTFTELAGDVETEGELTRGMTVFDRRINHESRANMEVAMSVRVDAARQSIIDRLSIAGKSTR